MASKGVLSTFAGTMEEATESTAPLSVERIFTDFPELAGRRAEAQLRALEALYTALGL